jgi:ABC-type Fe3+ transport system permease subunit
MEKIELFSYEKGRKESFIQGSLERIKVRVCNVCACVCIGIYLVIICLELVGLNWWV